MSNVKCQMSNVRRGFTLIELLVVIAIISLVVSVVAASWSGIKAKSRDTRRVSDIKAIQDALALHQTTVQRYPVAASAVVLDGTDPVSLELIASSSIQTVPADPRNNAPYQYTYLTDATGSEYLITYYLETNSISGKPQGENTATP